MADKKDKVVSKSKVKLNVKKNNASESFKSKSYVTSANKSSRIKQKVKNGQAKSSYKSVTKNSDGSYTLEKGKDNGNFTSRKVSKIRGKYIMNRYQKKK
tara:strand:+ start:109 stop:405 length:297 start_codon:yes stop_codon:yes gene_type:complete